MIGMRAAVSARTVPFDARPMRRRGVAAGEVADEHPVLHEMEALRGHAVVVERERADRAGDRGVGDDVHERRAVAERAEHRRLEERAAGERDLQAHGAIELGGMAARLVDLQRELRGADDEIEASGGRFRRGEERQRLVADLQRLRRHVQPLDELPPLGLKIAAERIGIRAPLELVAVDGHGLDAAAHLRRGLFDEAADRRCEELSPADSRRSRPTT